MADASSAIASATGRLQKIGVSTSSARVTPGPSVGTASSIPYGPPLTLKNTIAAGGKSPTPRRTRGVSPPPPGGGDEPRKLREPFVERPRRLDGDLELSAGQPPDAAGRGRTERNHQRLAVDAERVGHREDRVDLLHRHHLEHGC